METTKNNRPSKDEHAEYYSGYVDLVDERPILNVLEDLVASRSVLSDVPPEKEVFRYQAGKWSIRELVGHLIDTERVMSNRAFAFARGDGAEIAGMDQDEYVSNAGHDDIPLSELIEEFEAVRRSSLYLFKNLSENAWSRSGVASGSPVTVRALAYIIAGHEMHHMGILKERYLSAA